MSKKTKARRLAKNAAKAKDWKARLERPGACQVLREAEAVRASLTVKRDDPKHPANQAAA